MIRKIYTLVTSDFRIYIDALFLESILISARYVFKACFRTSSADTFAMDSVRFLKHYTHQLSSQFLQMPAAMLLLSFVLLI